MMIKKLIPSILAIVIVAASLALAGEVYAAPERAMWVWGMAKDIVLNATAKQDFFNFCAAPKGDATKAITLVFFDAKPYDFNLMTYNGGADLRQFIVDAHIKGIKIEFLSGDKSWATPPYRALGEALIDEVISFNLGGVANQRFDGIHYDVEPYLLDSKSKDDPLDWNIDNDKGLIWSIYLALLTNCQTKVNNYNASYDPDIRFGAAIPYWYVSGSSYSPESIISIVNYVAIMAYRSTAADIISAAQDEINYAGTTGKKVYVAVETSHPTDAVNSPPSATFYEEGNAAMETALTQVASAFSGSSAYAGIAIHYYEDLNGPKGYEASYRRLWTSSYLGHYPVVSVVSPTRNGEIFVGSVNIQWDASDLDGDSLSITLQYSADGGTNWTNIATGLSNTGYYLWNTTGLAVGSNYLVKVTATDNSANHLVGYGVSANTFSIATTVTQTDITDLNLWSESGTSLRLKWTPPNCTPRYYQIYRSVNGAAFPGTPTYDNVIAIKKYIDTGLSASNKYKYQIKAVYGTGAAGNPSNTSNTLIPGNTFLIDCAEQTEGLTYNGPYGSATLSYSFDTANIKEGSKSLRLDYTYTTGWGAILIPTYANINTPVKVDVSPYTAISFWVKGGASGGPTIRLQLRENGGFDGDEAWQSPAMTISNANWTEYVFNLSDFTRESVLTGTGNNILDLHAIGAYAIAFYGGTVGVPYSYYIDEIKLLQGAVNISVPQSSYSFGTLYPSASDRRFRIGPIPVTFGGIGAPWTIRIWTNNGGGSDHAGLKGADNVTYIPLKVWCANYGPGPDVPDEEIDTYWVGNTVGWFRIPEYSEMDPGNKFTWRRLCWGPGAELTNPFNFYLAIEAAGKPGQAYQTTTLTLDYLNE